MSFDTDFFIISIEQKKSIWNTSCTNYRDRDLKLKYWEDIGGTMNLNFKNFTGKQKDDYSKYIIIIILFIIKIANTKNYYYNVPP